MNIYLIGYRCSGKTTVGKILADRLCRQLVDMDREIETRTGKTIPQMVKENGWDKFREIERKVVSDIAGQTGLVVATGGGAVLDPQNVAAMKVSGLLVWLKVSVETVMARMMANQTPVPERPSLTDKSLPDEIRTTMEERHPIYQEAGDVDIDTENRDAASVCETILVHLAKKGIHRK
jgi:shikimate kinase